MISWQEALEAVADTGNLFWIKSLLYVAATSAIFGVWRLWHGYAVRQTVRIAPEEIQRLRAEK